MWSVYDFLFSLWFYIGRKLCWMFLYEGGEDVYGEDEDDVSFFCNFVLFIVCSSILDVDKLEKWIKDVYKLVDKFIKFGVVENWLKNLYKWF